MNYFKRVKRNKFRVEPVGLKEIIKEAEDFLIGSKFNIPNELELLNAMMVETLVERLCINKFIESGIIVKKGVQITILLELNGRDRNIIYNNDSSVGDGLMHGFF